MSVSWRFLAIPRCSPEFSTSVPNCAKPFERCAGRERRQPTPLSSSSLQKNLRQSGELRYHAVTSERDTRTERGFCPTCGSPVAGKLGARPDLMLLQAASLDDPSLFSPQMNIWTRSASPWDHLDPKLPSFETRAG